MLSDKDIVFAACENTMKRMNVIQEVATATAINIVRAVNYLNMELPAKTRVSRFSRLAN